MRDIIAGVGLTDVLSMPELGVVFSNYLVSAMRVLQVESCPRKM